MNSFGYSNFERGHPSRNINQALPGYKSETLLAPFSINHNILCISVWFNLSFYNLTLTLCTTSFNIQKFCVLPTEHLFVFLGSQKKTAIISQYSNNLLFFYNRGRERLLRGTDWVFKSNGYSFVLELLIYFYSRGSKKIKQKINLQTKLLFLAV